MGYKSNRRLLGNLLLLDSVEGFINLAIHKANALGKGKVYTKIIDDTKTKTLMPIIRQKIVPDSVVYTDCYRSYNALDVSEFYHFRINHSTHFAEAKSGKKSAEKIQRNTKKINLFLKECEFRFNYGSPKEKLKILKKWCF